MYNRLSQPSAIYIHVPFCVRKCCYCDFYSATDLSLIPDYLSALVSEMDHRSDPHLKIDTVYLGGGTPSVFSIQNINRILAAVNRCYSIASDAEVTLEVNPGTVTAGFMRDLKSLGVNRVSIGVQSFQERKLNFLDRIHTVADAVKTLQNATSAGFENINVDLIYGVPFETRSMWQKDLEKAVAAAPVHLSCYMLTIEEDTRLNTMLTKGEFMPIDDRLRFFLFKDTVGMLGKNGFEQYEISNYAKGACHRSRHNSKYWSMTPYLGFGPAAHSYNGRERFWNHRDINRYIRDMKTKGRAVAETERLSRDQKMLEMILLSFRTDHGMDLSIFRSEFGTSFEKTFSAIIDRVQNAGFGLLKQNRFVLTPEGKVRLDSIVEAFAHSIF